MKKKISYQVRPVPHTADLAFRITASSLPGLFAGAVRELFRSFIDLRRVPRDAGQTVVLEAANINELLFLCLKTLLDRYFSAGYAVRSVERIRILGKTRAELFLSGGRAGRPSAQGTPFLKREIKGVTYHQLDIQREGRMFSTLIVIDV